MFVFISLDKGGGGRVEAAKGDGLGEGECLIKGIEPSKPGQKKHNDYYLSSPVPVHKMIAFYNIFDTDANTMSIKQDNWIIKMAREHGMIEPFAAEQVRTGISFGVSSYGYDFRIADEFKIFDPTFTPSFSSSPLEREDKRRGGIIDPKKFNQLHFREFKGEICEIPPNGYVLARTVEYFKIPRNILTIAFGKSTYARCGIYIHVTPFEPEWEGFATIAISNATPLPARVYANEGIGQLIFLEADDICAVSYADKKGKYQAQKEITHAKI